MKSNKRAVCISFNIIACKLVFVLSGMFFPSKIRFAIQIKLFFSLYKLKLENIEL